MNLDDIEKLARGALHREPNPHSLSDVFARALLAMLPAVRAAAELVDNWRDTKAEDISSLRLESAIDTMRRQLGGE